MLNPHDEPDLTKKGILIIVIGVVMVILGVFILTGKFAIFFVAFGVFGVVIGTLFLPKMQDVGKGVVVEVDTKKKPKKSNTVFDATTVATVAEELI